MIHTPCCLRGMVTSPHHLASQAGLDILKRGGTAVEAGVAVAATLAVVYPHMTGIGGDGFWLIAEPDGRTHAIDACGAAAAAANLSLYEGHSAVPWRGPLAANSVAGTVSGWEAALAGDDGQLPLATLLSDAIHHADAGVPVTAGGAIIALAKGAELRRLPGGWAAGRLGGGIRAFAPAASRSIRSTPRSHASMTDAFWPMARWAGTASRKRRPRSSPAMRGSQFRCRKRSRVRDGKTWGEDRTSLKLENRFDPALAEALAAAGHDVQIMEPFTSAMAHDGAIVRHGTGLLEGATDPRSDGMVATW